MNRTCFIFFTLFLSHLALITKEYYIRGYIIFFVITSQTLFTIKHCFTRTLYRLCSATGQLTRSPHKVTPQGHPIESPHRVTPLDHQGQVSGSSPIHIYIYKPMCRLQLVTATDYSQGSLLKSEDQREGVFPATLHLGMFSQSTLSVYVHLFSVISTKPSLKLHI